MTTSHTPRYRWTWQSRNKQYEISVDKAKRIKLKLKQDKTGALGINHSSYSNVMSNSILLYTSILSRMESFRSLLLTV